MSCLIYAMGSVAENIYKSFVFVQESQKNDYAVVLGKFNEYFFLRRNVIHERVCFHQRVQQPSEKAEAFIRAVYELSEHCEFDAMRDENIRDRIVVSILDKELSRRLQLITNLTLAQTIQTVRQTEEVATQVSMQEERVGAVRAVVSTNKKHVSGQHKPEDKIRADSHGKCGNSLHARDEHCPAMKGKCHKTGHWARVC